MTAVAAVTLVRVVVDHTMRSAHLTVKINKAIDLALIVWSVSKTSSSVKNILSKRFST